MNSLAERHKGGENTFQHGQTTHGRPRCDFSPRKASSVSVSSVSLFFIPARGHHIDRPDDGTAAFTWYLGMRTILKAY